MKHNCKRAKLSITQIGSYKSDSAFYENIVELKKQSQSNRKEHKGVPTKTVSDNLKYVNNSLKQYREALRKPRTQRFRFKVFIKQYRLDTIVEWDYNPLDKDGKLTAYQYMIKNVIDKAISNVRGYIKPDVSLSKFAGMNTSFLGEAKKGRVFAVEGEVLRIYIKRNVQALYDEKKPTQLKKYIGIELEFCAPIKKDALSLKLFRAGIHKYAQLKTDGSLRPYPKEEGFELAILLEEANYKKDMKKITDLLAEIGARADGRRCGFHVHLDMRRRNKELVYSNLVACQYVLLSIVDPSRYNNEFCTVVSTRKWPTEFTGERAERYKTINAAAYYKYKTLEVRMHEGSVDYNQITNWVDLLVKITNYPKKLKSDISKLTILQKRIKMKKKLFDYALDRSCRFQVENSEETQNMRSAVRRSIPNDSRIIIDEIEQPSLRPLFGRDVADFNRQLEEETNRIARSFASSAPERVVPIAPSSNTFTISSQTYESALARHWTDGIAYVIPDDGSPSTEVNREET